MSAFGSACQTALYRALLAGNTVDGRIYDDAPEGVAFPWIEIGDRLTIPDDTRSVYGGSDEGVSDFYDLHVWSRDYAGKKEVEDIIDRIHDQLHGQALAVVGRVSALAWVRNIRVMRDPDGETQHGVVSVEIIHRSS